MATNCSHSRLEDKATTDAESILLYHAKDGVVTLTLNRPKKYNALSQQLLTGLEQRLHQIAADQQVLVVVLAATGKAFCPGHDLKQMRELPDIDSQRALFTLCAKVMQQIVNLPQPVIAKVHGMATAAGCQLVASCDLAIADSHAQFGVSGINVGLFCSTPAVALSRNVNRKRAMQMLLSGDFIAAADALEYGLVNQVVEPDQLDHAVNLMARKIAAKPARAIRLGKLTFNQQATQALPQAYDLAAEAMACNLQFAETLEGIDAFIERRPPDWNHNPRILS